MEKTPLTVVRSRSALTDALRNTHYRGRTVGFVPTMGALHNGHLSLVAQSRQRARATVASIFVNPTQFAPGEDFETYPRTEAEDLAKLAGAGCDLVYMPRAIDMYPEGSVTDVRVPGLSDTLDGQFRPHFFYGVTTVVARLFTHVRPDIAVFGEKDYQQLQIIRRMVRDLGFPIEIVGAPTVRDADGLAQSSRNLYLTAAERARAPAMYRTMRAAADAIAAGGAPGPALDAAKGEILAAGFARIDYVSAVDPDTLAELGEDRRAWPREGRLLAAAWLGRTRLIDNIALPLPRALPGALGGD